MAVYGLSGAKVIFLIPVLQRLFQHEKQICDTVYCPYRLFRVFFVVVAQNESLLGNAIKPIRTCASSINAATLIHYQSAFNNKSKMAPRCDRKGIKNNSCRNYEIQSRLNSPTVYVGIDGGSRE